MQLTVTGTGLVQLFWDVLILREAGWHGRDASVSFHAIRRTNKSVILPHGACHQGGGVPIMDLYSAQEVGYIALHAPEGDHYLVPEEVIQYQIIQHSLEKLEFRCTTKSPLTGDQKRTLTKILQEGLGYPFAIEISEVDGIARSASGKFEDFISRV